MSLMNTKVLLTLAIVLLAAMSITACGSGAPTEETSEPSLGAVELNAHPGTLDGKTILLRWNGKPNGDKFLTRVAELLTEQVPDVNIVKLWEVDADTALSSDSWEVSEQITAKVKGYDPDLVIASQCD